MEKSGGHRRGRDDDRRSRRHAKRRGWSGEHTRHHRKAGSTPQIPQELDVNSASQNSANALGFDSERYDRLFAWCGEAPRVQPDVLVWSLFYAAAPFEYVIPDPDFVAEMRQAVSAEGHEAVHEPDDTLSYEAFLEMFAERPHTE
ncbi:hypothetical protein JI721_00840 [Alicyclobacillus cycloheptanicus]|uniref:Uncharacterized protein n=1 Tax=Alicyclobacillus cycloheptanicus TaxID=1457 RepID=A0ABT9XKJ8_9BACL|nr:hypothetical protein [Alicyclobacillus cycloheptanicus]MDQ0190829.1 hypothetical protein [Alicyclobacillus cycloheptanicus]WDM01471.1 hypothetical protein JI721_00840 [Alicyclobacillus cycloheptanicus]